MKRPSAEMEFSWLLPVNVSVGLRVVMPSVLPVLEVVDEDVGRRIAIPGDEIAGTAVERDDAAVAADEDVEHAHLSEVSPLSLETSTRLTCVRQPIDQVRRVRRSSGCRQAGVDRRTNGTRRSVHRR